MKKDTLLETRNTLIAGLNRQVEELRPKADQATRFEEELKEANNELAQTHKKVQRLENIVEKYKQKAEENNALLRQNEVNHIL
jgi:ferritin-like metal-binding protein YciE